LNNVASIRDRCWPIYSNRYRQTDR